MSIDKTIVIANEFTLNQAVAVINGNWRVMSESGHPMAVRLYEHKDKRTIEQNSYMWKRLGEIEKQAWIDGRTFAAEVWHVAMKKKYLPEEDGPSKRVKKGYQKWVYDPLTGERELNGSTTELTTFGMSEYLHEIEAFAAQELGVRFSANPREYEGY